MTTKTKSHKAMGDGEWMSRLRAFASTGVWPPGAGNRPAPRQRKWHDLYQKIEKCPMQAKGQSGLFGQARTCSCGFHAKPATQSSPPSTSSAASASAPEARTYLRPPLSLSMFTKSHYGGSLSSAVQPNLVKRRTPSPSPVSTPDPQRFCVVCEGPQPFTVSLRAPSPSVSSVRTPSPAPSRGSSQFGNKTLYKLTQSGEPGGRASSHAGSSASFWLPGELSKTIPLQDQRWIANTLFHSGKLRPDLKLWYEPPVPALIYHQTPTPEPFFTHRLMVWMPYHLWKVKIACPTCGKQLTGAGVHKRARKVLDIDRYYLLVTETLRCTVCVQNHLSTSQTVRDQLDLPHQQMFRLILTRKYACDIRVIRLLRDRTLGNSPARLVKQLRENHGEEWLDRLVHYLGECAEFVDKPSLFPVVCREPPEPMDIPTSRWLLVVYGRDILSRLDHIKARITSTFGSILKLDSTKKITKKLAGTGRGTALWLTSVSTRLARS
ncbi:uncharacterized protein LOC121643495 [Melanotaenia boesemani]|uniref:uncharacterized protein LOC121643495 n=1 Tax=Melanotaenia boesemani TaxID=1250792 RepID=UPI001C04A849|nr:uncharacterized protein LOC121643495 [Melanotaenia boesemani]